jgi:hypothetical protein
VLCWPSTSWGQGNTQIDPTQVRGGVGGGTGSGIPFGIGGGTAQVQTVTTVPVITSWTNGQWVSWAPVATNTGPGTTLTVDGLAAVPITKCGTLPLVNGDIQPNPTAYAQYDATNVVLNLANPINGCPGLPTTAGTANAQTVTIQPPVTGHVPGQAYNMFAGISNTGAMTLNIGGGVWNVTKCGGLPLAASDWPLTSPNKTIMIVLDDGVGLQLNNPMAVSCGSSTNPGPWSKTQVAHISAGCTVTPCVVTLASTGANHALVVAMLSNAAATMGAPPAGACNVAWIHGPNAPAAGSGNTLDAYYCTQSVSGVTSFSQPITSFGGGTADVVVWEAVPPLTTIAIDAGSNPANKVADTTCTSCAGVPLTLSGNPNFIIVLSGGTANISGLTGTGFTYDGTAGNFGDGFGSGITTGSLTAPATWTATSGTIEAYALALQAH